MVDALAVRPPGAETWKPAQTAAPTSLSREHVVKTLTGESGATRIKLSPTFIGRPAPEIRAGGGIGQAGPGIGEARPLAAQPYAEQPVPIFTAPLGEVRI